MAASSPISSLLYARCHDCSFETILKRYELTDRGLDVVLRGLSMTGSDTHTLAVAGPEERRLLTGPVRPVVLLRRRTGGGGRGVAPEVAPRCPDLGFMLPYTPVHHLLLGLPGDPPGPRLLVMTSANLSGEPIVTEDAFERLRTAGYL